MSSAKHSEAFADTTGERRRLFSVPRELDLPLTNYYTVHTDYPILIMGHLPVIYLAHC